MGPLPFRWRREDAEHCSCRPDVILLCVKGYSLAETVPALKRLCDAHTIVIPILNLYGTGDGSSRSWPPPW